MKVVSILLYECTRKSVDKSDVEDDRDVKEGHNAIGEDELVDDSEGEVDGDPPQQDEVDSAQDPCTYLGGFFISLMQIN